MSYTHPHTRTHILAVGFSPALAYLRVPNTWRAVSRPTISPGKAVNLFATCDFESACPSPTTILAVRYLYRNERFVLINHLQVTVTLDSWYFTFYIPQILCEFNMI